MDKWYEQYLDKLQKFKPLDEKWFPEALALSRSGDLEQRFDIVGSSLQHAWKCAISIRDNSRIPLSDLVEEANTMIEAALNTFLGHTSAEYINHLEKTISNHLKKYVAI